MTDETFKKLMLIGAVAMAHHVSDLINARPDSLLVIADMKGQLAVLEAEQIVKDSQ